MTALDELRGGSVGDAFVALLQRTIRAVAISRGFPPPEGHASWSAAAVASTVNDFLSSSQTPRRLSDLGTRCRTDDALRRQLQEAVRNFYADSGRRTPVGRLVLRINEVLGDDSSFERRGPFWAIAGSKAEPQVVDHNALVVALASVQVIVPTAWMGRRSGPDIDVVSVLRLASAALAAAGGPLRAGDIAQAVARRLGLGGAPLSIEATAFDLPAASAGDLEIEDQIVVEALAREVFDLLNDHERIAIGLPGVPVAKLGPMLGVSGSKAALIRKRAVTILQDELGEEEDGQAVADAVLNLAREWTDEWMI